MSDVWETKDGRRRVRRDPPTIEDAVLAAQGMSDEVDGQIEIVMSLMEVTAEEARSAVLRMGQRKDTNHLTVAGRRRHGPHRCGRTPGAAPRADAPRYSQRRVPGSGITRDDTSRCQMKSTIKAPTTAPISPAPYPLVWPIA